MRERMQEAERRGWRRAPGRRPATGTPGPGAAAAGGGVRAGADRGCGCWMPGGREVTDRRLAGVISDVSLLDLTLLTSAEELAAITRISDVAIVLVPGP